MNGPEGNAAAIDVYIERGVWRFLCRMSIREKKWEGYPFGAIWADRMC